MSGYQRKMNTLVNYDPEKPSLLKHHDFLILGPKPESSLPHAEQLYYFFGIFYTHGHKHLTAQAKDSFYVAYGARFLIVM